MNTTQAGMTLDRLAMPVACFTHATHLHVSFWPPTELD